MVFIFFGNGMLLFRWRVGILFCVVYFWIILNILFLVFFVWCLIVVFWFILLKYRENLYWFEIRVIEIFIFYLFSFYRY